MRNANCAGPKGTPRCSRRRLKTFSTAALHAQSASAEQLAVASGATTILVSVASSNATHPEYVDDAPGAVAATTSGLSTRNATVTSRTFADGTNVAVSCLHAPSAEAPARASSSPPSPRSIRSPREAPRTAARRSRTWSRRRTRIPSAVGGIPRAR